MLPEIVGQLVGLGVELTIRQVPILKDYPLVSESAIWLVYPSSRLLAPKVRAFIDYFTEYFGIPPYWEQALYQDDGEGG